MSISIDPISAGASFQQLQQSQKITQPDAAGAQSTDFNARTASAPGNTSAALDTPATKAAAEAKDGESVKLSIEQTRQTEQSLQEINKVLASLSVSVQFQIDPEYKDVIVKVVDQDSGKIIRQIPSEDVVRISKAMDNLKGLLFAQTV